MQFTISSSIRKSVGVILAMAGLCSTTAAFADIELSLNQANTASWWTNNTNEVKLNADLYAVVDGKVDGLPQECTVSLGSSTICVEHNQANPKTLSITVPTSSITADSMFFYVEGSVITLNPKTCAEEGSMTYNPSTSSSSKQLLPTPCSNNGATCNYMVMDEFSPTTAQSIDLTTMQNVGTAEHYSKCDPS